MVRSCYNQKVEVNELVIANTNEFDLKRGKVYRVTGYGFGGCICVVNELGEEDAYAKEYFDFYEGQIVKYY